MTQAAITIDDRFFEVAARQSSSYPRLWTITKETIQNSQDAGASQITFNTRESWVSVDDNGPGMRGTGGIANFLTIGASVKNESNDTVGFFSTAKMRICFIHKDWRIRTNDQYLEKGMLGGNIQEGLEEHRGCLVEVQSRNGDWDDNDIRDYVALCNPKLDVRVNGQRLRRSYREGTLKAEFTWGRVYVNRGEKSFLGSLVVRVNGLAMYTGSLPNVKAQVTVELDASTSHLVLQENREALVWSATVNGTTVYPKNELSRFVDSLIINPHSVRPTVQTIVELVSGNERSQIVPRRLDIDTGEPIPMQPTAPTGQATRVGFGQHQEALAMLTLLEAVEEVEKGTLVPKANVEDYIGKVKEISGDQAFSGHVWADDDGIAQDDFPSWLNAEDFFEPAPPPVPRVMPWLSLEHEKEFLEIFPWDYVLVYDEGKKPSLRVKHARVMRAWKEITEIIAAAVGIFANYGVGLSVKQESKASWTESTDGDFLLIDFHQIKTTAKQLPTVMKLVKLACHELTHAHGWFDHTEAFMIEEERIFEVALENLKEIRAVAKGLTVQSRQYW